MKKLVLVIALVFLAGLPMFAAENSPAQAVPAMTFDQQTTEAIPMLIGIIKPIQYCSTLHGTSCPSAGATTSCTDVCHNNLSCTCYNYYGGPYGTTFLGRYWYCDYEC